MAADWFVIVAGEKLFWPQVIQKIATGAWSLEQAVQYTGMPLRSLGMRLQLEVAGPTARPALRAGAEAALRRLAAQAGVQAAEGAVVRGAAGAVVRGGIRRLLGRLLLGLAIGTGALLTLATALFIAYEAYQFARANQGGTSSGAESADDLFHGSPFYVMRFHGLSRPDGGEVVVRAVFGYYGPGVLSGAETADVRPGPISASLMLDTTDVGGMGGLLLDGTWSGRRLVLTSDRDDVFGSRDVSLTADLSPDGATMTGSWQSSRGSGSLDAEFRAFGEP